MNLSSNSYTPGEGPTIFKSSLWEACIWENGCCPPMKVPAFTSRLLDSCNKRIFKRCGSPKSGHTAWRLHTGHPEFSPGPITSANPTGNWATRGHCRCLLLKQEPVVQWLPWKHKSAPSAFLICPLCFGPLSYSVSSQCLHLKTTTDSVRVESVLA